MRAASDLKPLACRNCSSAGRVERLAAQLVQAERDGGVGVEADQAVGQSRLLGVGLEDLAALGLLDPVEVGEDAFERAELGQELGGVLGADAGDAGDVVGGVADQRQGVADQLRADAEALDHLGAADRLLLHRVPHGDPSATSCIRSLSEETTVTGSPAARASLA